MIGSACGQRRSEIEIECEIEPIVIDSGELKQEMKFWYTLPFRCSSQQYVVVLWARVGLRDVVHHA